MRQGYLPGRIRHLFNWVPGATIKKKPMAASEEFAKLYPTLSPRELQEAEYNFGRYLKIAMEVAQESEKGTSKHAMEDRGKEVAG